MLALAAALAAAALLAACGPSGKQVATAKQARYQGDRQQIFAVIKQTVASSYKIRMSDEAAFGLQTEGRWYNPEGQAISASPNDVRDVPDQSLLISLVVTIVPEGDRSAVSVKPTIMRYHKGRPNPEALEATDPSLPGWVHGKGDNLQVSLHEALQQYEANAAAGAAAAPAAGPPAPGPSQTPPPTTAPMPDPVGPTVTPPPPAP